MPGVAKGSLSQYFADKRDLYAFIADIASQRVRSAMEDLIRELDPNRPFFEFLTDLPAGSLPTSPSTSGTRMLRRPWKRHRCPHQRAQRPAPATTWTHGRWCATRTGAGRPARRFRHRCIDVVAAADLSCTWRWLHTCVFDLILGLRRFTPEQPALAVRRLVAVLAAAFDAQHRVKRHKNELSTCCA